MRRTKSLDGEHCSLNASLSLLRTVVTLFNPQLAFGMRTSLVTTSVVRFVLQFGDRCLIKSASVDQRAHYSPAADFGKPFYYPTGKLSLRRWPLPKTRKTTYGFVRQSKVFYACPAGKSRRIWREHQGRNTDMGILVPSGEVGGSGESCSLRDTSEINSSYSLFIG
jgi:hypothetical protein